MKLFTIKSKKSPKWHEFRKRFANWLVKMAHKIDPGNEDAYGFICQAVMENAISGGSIEIKHKGIDEILKEQ